MIVSNKHPIIAREGLPYIAAIFFALLSSLLFFHLVVTLFLLLMFAGLLFVFRDPIRNIPPSPLGIVSPVDGKIISISKTDNAFNPECSYQLSIQMATLGVYSLRSPIEGKMLKQWTDDTKGSQKTMNWIQTDEGDNVIWTVQAEGRKRAQCYVQPGERIGQGQRCGFLLFGAKIELLIAANSHLDVEVGSEIRAGETILAHIVHQRGAGLLGDPTLIIGNAG